MKKLYSFLLAILVSTTLQAYDACIDGIYYNLFNDKAEVTCEYYSFSSYYCDVIIPETIRYEGKEYTVTSIGNQAFMNSHGLTSVTIPSTVVSIGTRAFYGNEDLITVRVNSKTPLGIESDTFSNQANATLIVPEGCRPAYSNAEYWNEFKVIKEIAMVNEFCFLFDIDNMIAEVQPKLDDSKYSGEIIIPSSVIYDNDTYSVTSIGEKAFYNCSGMTSITIPGSIASIWGHAFYGCKGLTDITIPGSVTSISNYAFFGCSGLTAVTIPKSVTSIGLGLFSRCSNLISIIVEEGNPKYDSRDDCSAVIETATNTLVLGCKTTEIPESVTSIGNHAFHCCEGLTSVTLPENLTSIDSYGFSYCSFTSITIPDKVKTLGNFAFLNCEKLTSVTLGNNVTNIGNGAFEGCSGLTSVIIPNSVTNIGNFAFSRCTSLNSVVIGSGVEYIGDWAFEFCRSLVSVKVERKNPPTIRYNPFDYSTQRSATLYVPVGSKTAYSEAEYWKNFEKIKECFPEAEVDGIYYSFDIVNMVAEVLPNPDGSKYSGEIIIPSSVIYDNETYCVTGIGDKAFYNCNGMTSITIPDSIASIGENAFYGCKGLIDITIPESVTNISDYAFFGCSGLTAVTIPKNVTSIGLGLFSRCSNLISIIVEEGNPKYDSRDNCNAVIETATNTLVLGCKTTEIPESVTSIGNDAFHCCEGLTSVTLPENLTSIGSYGFSYCSFTSITIPDKVKTIGNFAFFNCEKLTSVTLGNSVTNIGNGAFEGCSGMTSVIIPNSVTNIGNFAFEDCTSLSSIVIGSGVEYIGDMAFFACYSLEKIYCYAEETPDVSDETFWGITMGNVKLIVPKQSVEKYKVHPVWGQFLIDTATAIELPVNNTEVREPIYNLSGQRVHAPQNGLNIIGGKKVLLR